MASSEYWRELANLFRLVPGGDLLRADGTYIVGSGREWNWELKGGATGFVLDSFESLARRGATEIASIGGPDLLVVWLEAVKKRCFTYFHLSGTPTEVKEDGSKGTQYVTGIIDRLCEASAGLCKILENEAIQAEFEKKQIDNPKNWSPFRQQIEALQSVKEIRDEPPFQIPEAVVRNIIARIDGTKPEDVTWKRIAFEIAGLGGPNRRHIEVVPSIPPPESPPIPEAKPRDQAEAKTSEPPPQPAAPAPPPPAPTETVAAQLQRLREECHLTTGELAEQVNLEVRSVQRHLAGTSIPYDRHIRRYESEFSKLLTRKVFIRKMS